MFLLKKSKLFSHFLSRSLPYPFSILHQDGSIVDLKDEIVFFKNFSDKNLKYQSLLKISEPPNHVFVLSLNEKISCGPLLKKIPRNVMQNLIGTNIELETNENELKFMFSKQIFGKVVDFRGNIIESEENPEASQEKNNNEENFKERNYSILEIFKGQEHTKKRVGTDGQIWTGNLAVDYSNPIAKGNYVVCKGEHSTGKSQFTANIIKNFLTLEESPIYNTKFKQSKAIYVALTHQNARKIKSLLDAYKTPQNYTIFSPAPNASLIEKFLLPFSALKFARDLQQELKNDVLFVFDDALEHYYKEIHLFNAMNQAFSPLKFCNELHSVTGCFVEGSLTSIVVMDLAEPQPSFYKGVENFKNNADSFADVIINFDLADEVYRHTKPKIDFELNRNVNPWQSTIVALLKGQLFQILERLKNERVALEGKKELKIHIDPWDAYFFLDSTYFMRLLISKRYFSPIESLILVRFTLKSIEEDLVGFFKDEPDILVEKLFTFCKKLNDFEGKDIFTFLREKMVLDLNDPNLAKFVWESLNRIHELFLTHLKMTDCLLPFKKDYFK